jgi:hypothetical protein
VQTAPREGGRKFVTQQGALDSDRMLGTSLLGHPDPCAPRNSGLSWHCSYFLPQCASNQVCQASTLSPIFGFVYLFGSTGV